MSLELLRSTFVIGFMTLISRVLGFIRDMVIAHVFGAGPAVDAFIVAFKIPNFLRRLFAEGAFSQAFVPILSEYRTKQSDACVKILINRVTGSLSLVLFAVTVIGIIIAPLFILIFAPGFKTVGEGSRFVLATEMLRITFPYLFFISLTALAGGVLNSYGRFAVPAFTPVFLNLMMIFSAIFLAPFFQEPIIALSLGVLLGGILQLLFQWPFLARLNLLPRIEIHWQDKGVKRILLLMAPALLGVSVNQFNLMLSSIFASFLQVGSVAWLYYAERLMEFPLGGFGVALATVVLPRMAKHHANQNQADFSATLDWGLRWVLLIGMPAAFGLALLSGPLLTTLFQSGRFNDHDVVMSQTALIAYSIGIIGFMCVKIFAAGYYAKQDIKTPVAFASITVVVNIIFSALFVKILAHTGLALATSLAAITNAILLMYGLLRRNLYQAQPGWKMFLFQMAFALAALSFVLAYFNPDLEEWFRMTVKSRIFTLASLILGGIAAYVVTLLVSGLRVHHILVKEGVR